MLRNHTQKCTAEKLMSTFISLFATSKNKQMKEERRIIFINQTNLERTNLKSDRKKLAGQISRSISLLQKEKGSCGKTTFALFFYILTGKTSRHTERA